MNRHRHGLLPGVGFLVCLIAISVCVNAAQSSRSAQTLNVPAVLSYQGVLCDSQSDPLTGTYTMTFRLYTNTVGGVAFWSEIQSVPVSEGLFSVYLGDVTALDEALFDGQDLYLGVSVGMDDEMTPRLRLASMPYAFSAQQVLCTRLVWYYDGDGDGYGDPAISYEACECPPSYVGNGEDCDDTDPDLNPDTIWYQDSDDDSFGNPVVIRQACEAQTGYVRDNTDCDDTDADVNPDAAEVCDGLDNDCDDQVDEELAPPLCALQDGVCSGATSTCGGGSGWLPCTALEYGPDYEVDETLCDGKDNDCDGEVDEGCP